MATIDEQIKAKTDEINRRSANVVNLTNQANALIKDGNDDTCGGFGWKKERKTRCETEKKRKLDDAQALLTQVNIEKSLIETLNADIKELSKSRTIEAEAIKILAGSGKTPASIQTEAEALAEATRIQAVTKSEIEKTSAQTTDNTKQAVIGLFVFVLVVAVVIVAIRKFKKRKK